jgi:FkbM family methyltransferase
MIHLRIILTYITLAARKRLILKLLKIFYRLGIFRSFVKYIIQLYDPNNIRRRYPGKIKDIRIISSGIYGEIVELHLNQHVDYQYFMKGFFDSTLHEVVKELNYSPSDTLIIDIGANVGLVSISLALKGFKVHAVESLPEHIYKLERNLKLNSLSCPIIPFVLSDEDQSESILLHVPSGNSGASSFDKNYDFLGFSTLTPTSVSVSTLDSVLKNIFDPFKKLILKIDVEGMEIQVLNGGAQTINRHRPIILMEWKSQAFDSSRAFKLNEFLSNYSYNIARIFLDTQNRIFVKDFFSNHFKCENVILTPKELNIRLPKESN